MNPAEQLVAGLAGRLNRMEHSLATIHANTVLIIEGRKALMAEIDDLKEQVARQGTVVQSVVALVEGLHQQLGEAVARQDMTAVAAITNQLRTNTDALAAAVTLNTPMEAPAAPQPAGDQTGAAPAGEVQQGTDPGQPGTASGQPGTGD